MADGSIQVSVKNKPYLVQIKTNSTAFHRTS